MSKKKRNESKRKLPYPRKEEAEFGKAKKGIFACKRCGAYFYKKSWHHELHIRKNGKKLLTIGYIWCPACSMIDNGEYEGKVLIENAPERLTGALIALVKAYSARAYRHDSQHRLIEIKRENGNLAITTTENQLAAKLGRKIKETFKKVDLHITHAEVPSDVTLAKIQWK